MVVFLGFISSMLITTILRGFVFQKLWMWFIVPLFQLSSISIVQSLGLMLIVSLVTPTDTDKDGEMSLGELLLKGTIRSVVASLYFLVVGFIVQLFI